jgi:hypothetical protein
MFGMMHPAPLNFRRTRESIPFGRLQLSCDKYVQQHGDDKAKLGGSVMPNEGLQPAGQTVESKSQKNCLSFLPKSPLLFLVTGAGSAANLHCNLSVRLMTLEFQRPLLHYLRLRQGLHHLVPLPRVRLALPLLTPVFGQTQWGSPTEPPRFLISSWHPV